MKVSAATPKPTTRKEAYGKEVTEMFLRRINRDERDRKEPRVWRAAIYLSEPAPHKSDGHGNGEPSIAEQRMLCRYAARWLRVDEVVGEFTDTWQYGPVRPALHQALEVAQDQQLDYLIVSSLDRLADTPEDFIEVAWRLGHAGTVPMPAEPDGEPPSVPLGSA